MAYYEDKKFVGVVEFFLQEEWYEVDGLIEKIRFYLQGASQAWSRILEGICQGWSNDRHWLK